MKKCQCAIESSDVNETWSYTSLHTLYKSGYILMKTRREAFILTAYRKNQNLQMCDFTRVWEDWHPIGILLAS